jgi:hypothetical protein
MLENLAAHIQKEWAVLKTAPAAFVMLAIVSIGAGVAGGTWYYAGQVGSLHEQLYAKDDQLGRYRVALGIDPASKGALVELSNQELALKAQSIVAKLRSYAAMMHSENQGIEKRFKDGTISDSQAMNERLAAEKNVSEQFDRNLASDAYNVENELKSRLDPVTRSHIVGVPAFRFGSDPHDRVTMSDLFRRSGFAEMLGGLADEMEEMARLLSPISATK